MSGSGTKSDPWRLKTPPRTSEYEMYLDERDGQLRFRPLPKGGGGDLTQDDDLRPVVVDRASTLFEHAVEPLARLQQLLLELASRRSLGLLPLELVVQVLVVVDERGQLLAQRKSRSFRGAPRTHRKPEEGLEPTTSALQKLRSTN